MRLPVNVLADTVIDGAVPHPRQAPVGAVLVGVDGRSRCDVTGDEPMQRGRVGPFDALGPYFSFALQSADDNGLAGRSAKAAPAARVPVAFLAAEVGVSSTSTVPESRWPPIQPCRMRCAMNQALFCVIPRSRCSFTLETPLSEVVIRCRPTTHLRSGSRDDSMTVPSLTLKYLLHLLHQ